MVGSKQFHLTVGSAEIRRRLDRTLADHISTLSRTRLKTLIQAGLVEIDAKPITDPAYRLSAAEKISVTVPPSEPASPMPQPIPLTVVYEEVLSIVLHRVWECKFALL